MNALQVNEVRQRLQGIKSRMNNLIWRAEDRPETLASSILASLNDIRRDLEAIESIAENDRG